jgi:DNA-binding PadR family transcriptional regulator
MNANPMPDDVTSLLPLKPRVFHLLLALSHGPQHGYGVKKAIKERTDGTLDLDPGGLYRLVGRLEEEGLVTDAAPPASEESSDSRRRYYTLTPHGEATLRAEARRLADIAAWPDVKALARAGRES